MPAIDGSNLTGISGTTINNNADNRILTGTGSANTIQGESQLLFDSNGLLYLRAPDGGNRYFFGETGNSQSAQLSLYNSSDQQKVRIVAGDGASTGSTFFNGGSVGIGLTNPEAYDSYANQLVVYGAGHAGMTIRGNYANTGNIYFADGTSGGEKYDGYISYSYPTQRLALGAGGNTIAKITTDGICFGSDTAAANALDDYEEGDSVITAYSNNNVTINSSYNTMTYTKIGNVVTVTGLIVISGVHSGNYFRINMPFQNKSRTNPVRTDAIGVIMHNNVNTGDCGLVAYLPMGSSVLNFYKVSDNSSWSILTNSDLASGDEMYFTITYKAQ